jgi:hypothetical protein
MAMMGALRGNTRPYDRRKSQTDPAKMIKSASRSASRRCCRAWLWEICNQIQRLKTILENCFYLQRAVGT